jgi:2-hydroxy-3-oxopropionate reductase
MNDVGFIGLGIMGSPMATNLQSGGFQVTGFNRTSGKDGDLLASGGRSADTLGGAVDGADVVCLMLPDSPDVEQVMTGADGVIARARPGALVVDFSTIRPDVGRNMAALCRSRGLSFLDAPVSGGQAGAINASLSIMVGGHAEDVAAARPVLSCVGKTVVHVGPHGAGQVVKAANQVVVAANIAALAEALLLLEGHDIAIEGALEVLANGLAGSRVLDQKAHLMAAREFAPGFRVGLHAKDLRIGAQAAHEVGLVMPMMTLVAQLLDSAVANGDGGLDHAALMRVAERMSGRATTSSR